MPEVDELSWEANWVQGATGIVLTADAARCVDALSSIQRPYNWVLINNQWSGAVSRPPYHEPDDFGDDLPPLRAPVEIGPTWMIVRLMNGLSTYDFDDLTRLVVGAHRHAVRVEVGAETYRSIDYESYLSERDGEGKWVETDEHPVYPAACMRVQLNARQHDGVRMYERHPDLAALAGLCHQLQIAPRVFH